MPKTADPIESAKSLIKNRLAEVKGEQKRLRSALSSLGQTAPSKPPRANSSKNGRRQGPSRRRRANGATKRVLAELGKAPKAGVAPRELAERTGVSVRHAGVILSKAAASGKAKRISRGRYGPSA